METVSHHGRTTAYRRTDFGDGDPVVYVHGSGGIHEIWVHQYGNRGDRPAVALDLSGHGESDDVDTPAGPETLDAYAEDVVAVARETGATALVGNSLGGAVIQHVALERDFDAEALVLCGTGAKLGVHDELKRRLADDFDAAIEMVHGDDMLFHDAGPQAVADSKETMRAVGREVTERDFLTCDAFDVRDRVGDIDTPSLAITGEHDRLTPVKYHEYLAEHLPDCELAVVEGAAHLSMLERGESWNEAVDGFLAGLE
ncbi:alpha/beta fold hydrolase [Halomarina litorea]|uniref:alpha/beta fold hydrolase n=1 Tax=Halomarina litorea TaxID=2961595 RepID=UPI0020C1E658|nr:alpha/beta hydrolase [Halomarina sp. BCD28]